MAPWDMSGLKSGRSLLADAMKLRKSLARSQTCARILHETRHAAVRRWR